MFTTHNTAQRPMFPTHSRLAVVRDVAVLAVCIGIVLAFLIEVWSQSTPTRHGDPPVRPAAVDVLA